MLMPLTQFLSFHFFNPSSHCALALSNFNLLWTFIALWGEMSALKNRMTMTLDLRVISIIVVEFQFVRTWNLLTKDFINMLFYFVKLMAKDKPRVPLRKQSVRLFIRKFHSNICYNNISIWNHSRSSCQDDMGLLLKFAPYCLFILVVSLSFKELQIV